MGSTVSIKLYSFYFDIQPYKRLEGDGERKPRPIDSLLIHRGIMANHADHDTRPSTPEPDGEVGMSTLRFSPCSPTTNVE